jgi:hypothetical protein
MNRHFFASVGVLALAGCIAALMSTSLAGQVNAGATPARGAEWTPPRTPWGDPDLRGVWDYRTITPLERPDRLAGKQVLTDAEAAEFETEENRRQNRDLVDPKKGGAGYPPESEGGVVPYNEFWYDRGSRVVETRRSSLIVDPADGRVPALTQEAQQRRDPQGNRDEAAGPEDRNLWERCITRNLPRLSGAYNNNLEIVQGPGYVLILHEMVHDVQFVPLDGRPHLPKAIRQWMGDSRGRWEGNTLVVDTTNFTSKTNFRGSRENLHLVQRFTLADPDTIRFEFTANDPTTWTKPWSAEFPMLRNPEPMYEYACHEGNVGLLGILTGARALEKAR